MKRAFIFIPIIFLAGCATKKPVVVQMPRSVPGTTIGTDSAESIRYAENLKAYPVGRYVDPNNQLMMHESHTVYRVETTAKWNLHPSESIYAPSGPVVQIIDPARKDSPLTPEIIAEINRQKDATKALRAQSLRMDQALTQLSTNISEARQAAQTNRFFKQMFVKAMDRVETLENYFRKHQTETLTNPSVSVTETNEW